MQTTRGRTASISARRGSRSVYVDDRDRAAGDTAVDPLTGKIGERRKVPFRRQPARLDVPSDSAMLLRPKPPCGRRSAHRRIVTQTFASLISSYPQAAEHGCRSNPTSAWRLFLPVRVSERRLPSLRMRRHRFDRPASQHRRDDRTAKWASIGGRNRA
jgi:hypothetical protein